MALDILKSILLFRKPQSNCLRDLPAKSRSLDYSIMDNKPGVLYDASKQCEMQFGTGSNVCHKDTVRYLLDLQEQAYNSI